MASYVLKGYQTPLGVSSAADVAAYQRQLNSQGAGLKVDGIWGPKTEAAYQKNTAAQVDPLQKINEYMERILALYDVPQVQYSPRSAASFESEYASFLRPDVDQSISRRKDATATYQAELDADAISRGMGASTYVTDVKDRQMDAEADDIAAMESNYQATLSKMIAEAVAAEQQRAYDAAVFNANQMSAAKQMAFSAAQEMYSADLTRQQAAAAATSSRSKSKTKNNIQDIPTTSPENCERFLQILTPQERAAVYQGKTDKDLRYQQELIASVGELAYYQLQDKYPAK